MHPEPPPLPAQLPPPLPQRKPRIWAALTVAGLALLATLVVSAIVQLIALFAMGVFRSGARSFDIMGATQRMIAEPWGPAALILPGQLTMLAAACLGAWLSPQRVAPRLGYKRSLLPWWTLPLLLAGTFFSAGLGGLLVESLFKETSTTMQLILDMMQKASGGGLVGLVFMLCVLPPLSEEALFRGYLQRRLLQRWHPAAAIAVSSLFFVVAHFDPEHVLGVVPLAIWLGVVAWRCDSLWPSMLCHSAQNSFALWATRHGDPLEKGMTPPELAIFAFAGLLTLGAVAVMRRHPVPGRMAPT